jgi:hypothetical protein
MNGMPAMSTRVLMQRYRATKRGYDQHRPLIYPPSGIA